MAKVTISVHPSIAMTGGMGREDVSNFHRRGMKAFDILH